MNAPYGTIALVFVLVGPAAHAQPCDPIVTEDFEDGFSSLDTFNFGGSIHLGGGIKGTKGVVIERKRAGSNDVTFLRRTLPRDAAGRLLKVEVWVKYEELTPGPDQEYHHGGHVDYEAFTPSGARYPSQYGNFLGTRDWELHTVDWQLPKDATRTIFRMGLQGVAGRLYFDSLRIWLCR